MPGIESCSVRSANYLYITNPMWKHAPRIAESPHILLFVTDGVMYIEVQNVRYTVKPGECLFLPRGVISIGYRPSNVPTGYFFVRFKTDETAPAPDPAYFAVPDPFPLRELFTQLVKAASSADYPLAGLNALLHALFYTLRYQLQDAAPMTANSLADSIRDYVIDSFFRGITVNDVAAHFGFCPDYVNRVFSRAYHMTLKTYINRVRVSRIEEFLISTNVPIKEIAEKLNFPSPAALSKFYKYHTGRTPEEYRARFIKVIDRK